MKPIRVTMQHSEQTVHRLAGVQYNTFSGFAKLFWYLLCILGILSGFGLIADPGEPWRYVILAFSCVVIVNVGATGRFRASKTLRAIKAQGGVFPRTDMTFAESAVHIREEDGSSSDLSYDRIIRLVEDPQYLYLFITREAAYMVPLEQVPDKKSFMGFLEKQVGLAFQPPLELMNINLKTLSILRRNAARRAGKK